MCPGSVRHCRCGQLIVPAFCHVVVIALAFRWDDARTSGAGVAIK
jgi:hypothetical protein